jgi:hypothetical protein
MTSRRRRKKQQLMRSGRDRRERVARQRLRRERVARQRLRRERVLRQRQDAYLRAGYYAHALERIIFTVENGWMACYIIRSA